MIVPEEIQKGLWTFPIVLPKNPLKWLNCYVIKGESGGRNLLIDTGFNQAPCLETLLEGLTALDIRAEDTDVFLTHLHSDHTGNAAELQKLGCRIFMGKTDFLVRLTHSEANWTVQLERYVQEGLDQIFLSLSKENHSDEQYTSTPFDAHLLEDGDILRYGDYSLNCVLTPGHTPGHMCLYDSGKKLMFLGDHVLFDISPNIIMWPEMDDSLGSYIESLLKLCDYDVKTALPAHRGIGTVSLQDRIQHLIVHHRNRLADTVKIISETPGLTAYEIAGQMSWKIRAANWDSFPLTQKWFAFGETLAHLDYLVKRNIIFRQESGGKITYRKADKLSRQQNVFIPTYCTELQGSGDA